MVSADVRLAGRQRLACTDAADAHNYDPSFSSDGLSLAMASTIMRGDHEQWDIFVMDVNGRGLFRLTGDEGNERFPDFKP